MFMNIQSPIKFSNEHTINIVTINNHNFVSNRLYYAHFLEIRVLIDNIIPYNICILYFQFLYYKFKENLYIYREKTNILNNKKNCNSFIFYSYYRVIF